MRIFRYLVDMGAVPVDFLADPDGNWTYEGLLEAAGFDPGSTGIQIGALSEPFEGHPDGAAVITRAQSGRAYIAVVECVERKQPIQLRPERAPSHVQAA
jgi:hypothetical protein